MKMDWMLRSMLCMIVAMVGFLVLVGSITADAKPQQILLDTDVDTDDLFALLYLLKQNRSEFDLKAITISANAWTDAGHAVNQLYDILYMMNRDDIPIGVGGEGGILGDGTILPNVGGYLPIIEQGTSTVGNCRYRRAIPRGSGGRLDTDTNYGFRRSLLPQGDRRYVPLQQPTAQQVMLDTISGGPTTVILTGSHTNFALFLLKNPDLKNNIQHVYIMGGGVRSENPTGCCPKNSSTSCVPQECGDRGNLYTAYTSNPYAEFNIFGDPFAAYQVFHSGIPVTLIPLDATNTIPLNEQFFTSFQQQQDTYEAQYSFQSLNIIRESFPNNEVFYQGFSLWDSFACGVALSIMRNADNLNGENEFAEMEYLNITVVTSNEPYGMYDGSNPFFDGRANPWFNLEKDGVHSGHVQTKVQDPFCFVSGSYKGKCQDGYTKEVTGPEGVRVLVAMKAKPNQDVQSPLDREFFKSFLDVLNLPQQSGRFNFTTEFPYYRETFYKPDFTNRTSGKPVIFDMDMSAGDFLALIYLLKVPVEIIDLKGIFVSGDGWANAATIDVIYDVLHMMGRDDIPVGLGDVTALGTASLGCRYFKAIPQGSGGFLDSDTLYGLARTLPRSPRRYTGEKSVKYGAPRDTDHPELRQPLVMEVWQSITRELNTSDKITVLTNGPLTNLANIILSDNNATSIIQNVYIVGGQIPDQHNEKGNIFTVPSNKYAEFNMFLDPVAAKKVIESDLQITFIPLSAQRKVISFESMLKSLETAGKTPEALFAYNLLSLMQKLQQQNQAYHHMDIFLGEILGAVFLADGPNLNMTMEEKPVTVLAGETRWDGQIVVNEKHGKLVSILKHFNSEAYYDHFANLFGDKRQSAVIGSFDEQKKQWSKPPNGTEGVQYF